MVYIAASGIFTCSTDGSQTFAEITTITENALKSQLASLVDIADPLMRTIDDNSTKSLVEIVAVTLGHRIILIRNSQVAFGVDIPHLSTLVHDNGHAIAEIMGKMELKGNDNITLAIFIAIFSIFIFTGQPVRILLHLWFLHNVTMQVNIKVLTILLNPCHTMTEILQIFTAFNSFGNGFKVIGVLYYNGS